MTNFDCKTGASDRRLRHDFSLEPVAIHGDIEPAGITLHILSTTFDLRIRLTFDVEDMPVIGTIICGVVEEYVS